MTQGVTIGQAAAFADVTVKTVRHYHRLGLVGEPRRDSSGYRRYGSAELLRLVQVRILAGAGVPLAEIPALLDADPREFTTSLSDVEQRLTERIDELRARRTMLRRLAGGDRALLPERAQAVLDRFVALGFEPVYVEAQQEAMVLVRALVPDVFDDFLGHIERRLDDPEHVALLKRSWVAASWSPDDPRLEHLADDLAGNLLDRHLTQALQDVRPVRSEASARLGMINHHREAEFPAITRLNELVEARLRAAGVAVPQ